MTYVVVPSSYYRDQARGNCALLLISAPMVVLSDFNKGEQIPLARGATWQDTPLDLVIDEQKVALNTEGRPVYRYCIRIHFSKDGQDGLEGHDLQRLINANISIN